MPPSASQFFSARIVERRNISSDLLVVQVDPGGDFRGEYSALGCLGGQFANHSQMQVDGGSRKPVGERGFVS